MSGAEVRVALRLPQDADAERHAAFPPSPEILRMYGVDPAHAPAPGIERSRAWLDTLRRAPYARMVEVDGALAGHVRLHGLEPQDRRARLAVGLLAEAQLGRGIGRAAIRLALDDAFGTMGLHRVDLRVLAYNERAIRCYLACGFRHEGTEREAGFVGGCWHDDWIMGILAHEHRAA